MYVIVWKINWLLDAWILLEEECGTKDKKEEKVEEKEEERRVRRKWCMQIVKLKSFTYVHTRK